MSEWTATWSGKTVHGYEGPADLTSWDFGDDYFPWICDSTSGGLDFVCPNWMALEGGAQDVCQVGIELDDLVDGYMDVESVMDQDDATNRRNIAIDAFQRAIERLKNEPFRCKPVNKSPTDPV